METGIASKSTEKPTATDPKVIVYNGYVVGSQYLSNASNATSYYGATANHARVDLSDAGFAGGVSTVTMAVDYFHAGAGFGDNRDNTTILYYGNGTEGFGLFHTNGGILKLKVTSGGADNIMTVTGAVVGDGKWHNIILTRVGAAANNARWKIWVDGVEHSSVIASASDAKDPNMPILMYAFSYEAGLHSTLSQAATGILKDMESFTSWTLPCGPFFRSMHH
eukprot:jgi/Mesvir1/9663/Mv12148-RA.1